MRNGASLISRVSASRLAVLALLLVVPVVAQGQSPQDQGIGGTGAVPEIQEDDRGIGGTGVIGTIRRFGSIIVNNQRITYPRDVLVRINGQSRTAADLKVGQVVRVVAERRSAALVTRQIDVVSEVAGPIEAVTAKTITVLSQTVSTAALKAGAGWRAGDQVAVYGLRQPDGTIVASLVERRVGGAVRAAGQLDRRENGSFGIGRLAVRGVAPALAGQRVILEGAYGAGVLEVTSAVREQDLFGSGIRRYSIEAYVEAAGNGLRLGSGLEVVGGVSSGLPPGSSALAVITAVPDRAGRLTLERLRLEPPAAQPSKPRQVEPPPVQPSKPRQGLNTRGMPGSPGLSLRGREAPPSNARSNPARSNALDGSRPGTTQPRNGIDSGVTRGGVGSGGSVGGGGVGGSVGGGVGGGSVGGSVGGSGGVGGLP